MVLTATYEKRRITLKLKEGGASATWVLCEPQVHAKQRRIQIATAARTMLEVQPESARGGKLKLGSKLVGSFQRVMQALAHEVGVSHVRREVSAVVPKGSYDFKSRKITGPTSARLLRRIGYEGDDSAVRPDSPNALEYKLDTVGSHAAENLKLSREEQVALEAFKSALWVKR